MSAAPPLHPSLLIHDIVRLFRQCFSARIQDLGLSEAQWRALGTVKNFEGLSQTELADNLDIGKAPLGNLIDKLEEKGLVSRQADAVDRRIKRLYLTASAVSVTDTMRRLYDDLEREFLADLQATQGRAMLESLRQIYRNLSGVEAPPLVFMHLLTRITRQFSRHFDEELKQLGFTRSQWMVLVAIHVFQGASQRQLADALNMQKAPLGALVDELEQGGWVERRTDPRDRRARMLYLTEQCAARWPALSLAYESIHRQSLRGVPDGQRHLLRSGLHAVRGRLQAITARSAS